MANERNRNGIPLARRGETREKNRCRAVTEKKLAACCGPRDGCRRSEAAGGPDEQERQYQRRLADVLRGWPRRVVIDRSSTGGRGGEARGGNSRLREGHRPAASL